MQNTHAKSNLIVANESIVLKFMMVGARILIEGKHGTGKTTMVREAAKKFGCAEEEVYFVNCSTIDPYIHLIGVPSVSEDREDLKLVRPREIDRAKVIIFDEVNRANDATMNALFEITQFGSINGEELPNLVCVVAMMNPDNGDYAVSALDPAFIDRFDIHLATNEDPNFFALTEELGNADLARALVKWHEKIESIKGADEVYVSPRRLGIIGRMLQSVGVSTETVKASLGGTRVHNITDLVKSLKGVDIAPKDDAMDKAKEKGAPKRFDPNKDFGMVANMNEEIKRLLNMPEEEFKELLADDETTTGYTLRHMEVKLGFTEDAIIGKLKKAAEDNGTPDALDALIATKTL